MAKVEACGGVMGGGWHMALDLPIDFEIGRAHV